MLPVSMPSFLGHSALPLSNSMNTQDSLMQSPLSSGYRPNCVPLSVFNASSNSTTATTLSSITGTTIESNTETPFIIHIPNAIKRPKPNNSSPSNSTIAQPVLSTQKTPYVVNVMQSSLPVVLPASTITTASPSLNFGNTTDSLSPRTLSSASTIPETASINSKPSTALIPTAAVRTSPIQRYTSSFQPIKPISSISATSVSAAYTVSSHNDTSTTIIDSPTMQSNSSYFLPNVSTALPIHLRSLPATPQHSPASTVSVQQANATVAHVAHSVDSPKAISLPVTAATAAITNICNPLSAQIHHRFPNYSTSIAPSTSSSFMSSTPAMNIFVLNHVEAAVPASLNPIVPATPIHTTQAVSVQTATLANSLPPPTVQYSLPLMYESMNSSDSEETISPSLRPLSNASFSHQHVDGLSSSRLITHISKKPTKVLEYRVLRSAIPGTQLGLEHTGPDDEICVRIRVMGGDIPFYPSYSSNPNMPCRENLLFVAADISQLIHCRKSNIAKAVSLFTEQEKARMPIECPRSNGTLSTHILTVLTWAGVSHLLTSSRAPIAQPFFKWLTTQVDELLAEMTRRRTTKRKIDSEDEDMISSPMFAISNTRRRYSESSGCSSSSASSPIHK
jgi:prophage antirepressor-like protein